MKKKLSEKIFASVVFGVHVWENYHLLLSLGHKNTNSDFYLIEGVGHISFN